MGRRRGRGHPAPKPIPFADAHDNIVKMEAAVAYRTVTADFALMDMVRFIWPDEVVNPLLAAYPYARSRPDYVITNAPYKCYKDLHLSEITFSIRLPLVPLKMLAPADGLARGHHAALAPKVVSVLNELERIHDQFNVVRRVVAWLNDNYVTPGGARFYCPWLGALLPVGHPFHEADGLRYKEPTASMAAITTAMRQAGSIVAAGLLADPQNVEVPYTNLGIQVCTEDQSASQWFFVL